MVEAQPQGEVHAVVHSYEYAVSDEFIEAHLDETGMALPKEWSLSYELRDLPDAGQRRRARHLYDAYQDLPGIPTLPRPTDDPMEFLEGLERWVERSRQEREASLRARQERRERELEESRRFEAEKRHWIEEHGSERLRIALSRGYKVSGAYARERARHEIPGFWVDTSGEAAWRERVDPSSEALHAEMKVEAWLDVRGWDAHPRIVWLIDPPSGLSDRFDADDPFMDEFEPQEAILIEGYLGRYAVIMPIDREWRAPIQAEDQAEDEDES